MAELDRAGSLVTAIHAATQLQGLGATQLAAWYARAKLAAGWRLVAWVDGADTGSLRAGMAAIADATGLTDGDFGRGVADAGLAVRQWLEADGDQCLLVLDDVSDPEVLRSFVPAGGPARVLITGSGAASAAANLRTGAPLLVDVFGADEALSFLTGRTGLDDGAGAAAVADVLGNVPLALALAAPVIQGQRNGYWRYLDRLRTLPAEVSLTAENGQPYPHGVARAVLLALAAIRTADKTGMCARIIAIMSVLSSAGVRRELLHVAGRAGVLASGGRRVEVALVDQALEWLSERSLLTVSLDGQTVMMHRLVAQVVSQGLMRRQRLGAVSWVAASVLEAHAIAVAGSQDRPAVRHIPQQVTALNNTAELAGEVDGELAEILLRLRFISLYCLIELGDSAAQAIAVGESLTADLGRLLGPGHPDTLNARNSLAAAYLAVKRVSDAIPLLEQNLMVLQRQLGPDHPDTLTSQNNLASAYQDAGRVADAIPLYERNLAARKQLLGVGHSGTLNSQGNLAAAYLAAGRVAEAIPLLEQTLAARERALGPDHPDTQKSLKNLAKAYQDAGRAAEAIPLLEKTSAGRPRVLRPDDPHPQTARKKLATAYRDGGAAARAIPPARQPSATQQSLAPAGDAAEVLPAGFRRPLADPVGQLLSDRVAGPSPKLPYHSSPSRAQDPPPREPEYDPEHDREVVAAITAGDPAGIAMAYDMYAAALYGYCHWMVHDSADAATSLQDTFVIAAATLSDLLEPSKLRPWLFALARNECRRRIRRQSTTREKKSDAASQQAEADQRAGDVGRRTDVTHRLADVTMPFRVVSESASETYGPADAMAQFPLVSEPADATVPIPVVSQLADVTIPFRVISEPTDALDSLAHLNGYLGQAELQALVRSILADMKPREREVIELSFRHDLRESDLAIALGMSRRRAHALASRARGQLEKSFGALRTALAGRDACPVVGELLADWDGQLTEQTRDLVGWHIEQCQTCASHGRGGLGPTALSGLLPLAPLPPELREQVLSRCSATDKTAVAYRRRVVRRAESVWSSRFSPALRWMSWDSIRTNPGAAIASTALAVWVAAAVSVTLLTFASSSAAHAQAPQPTVRTSSSGPANPGAAANGRASTEARPSPSVSRPLIHRSSLAEPSQQPSSHSPTRSPSPSSSPSHSKSSTPSRSPSSTPSPSSSPSSSPTPSGSLSPSTSPTP